MAFGERKTLENSIEKLGQMKEEKNKQLMEKVFWLYGTDVLLNDLGFFLGEEVVTAEQVKNAKLVHTGLVKEIAKDVDYILENLNVPTHALYTPIAGDYV